MNFQAVVSDPSWSVSFAVPSWLVRWLAYTPSVGCRPCWSGWGYFAQASEQSSLEKVKQQKWSWTSNLPSHRGSKHSWISVKLMSREKPWMSLHGGVLGRPQVARAMTYTWALKISPVPSAVCYGLFWWSWRMPWRHWHALLRSDSASIVLLDTNCSSATCISKNLQPSPSGWWALLINQVTHVTTHLLVVIPLDYHFGNLSLSSCHQARLSALKSFLISLGIHHGHI